MKEITVNECITLRPLQTDDANDIFQTIHSQRDYLRPWLPFVDFTQQISDTEIFIQSTFDNKEIIFTLRYQNDFAGLIGFKDIDTQNKKIEVGYWLSFPFQKKGIVSLSLQAIINHAFTNMDMNRIQIKCAVQNIPSNRIPQRLNFRFEGIERDGELLSDGNFTDLNIYSILRKDWENKSTL